MHHQFSAIQSVPTLPIYAARLSELTRASNPTVDDFAQVLQVDPPSAARILREANSLHYGFHRQIFSVRDAALVLGIETLNHLLRSMPTIDAPRLQSDRTCLANLWVHARAVATAATLVARRVMFPYRDKAFTAGLLHDIGKIAIVAAASEAQREILKMAQAYYIPAGYSETLVFGVEHPEIGARLLQSWNLPPSLIDAVRLHHHPTRAGAPYDLSGIVCLADHLVRRAGIARNIGEEPDELDPVVPEYFGLNRSSLKVLEEQIISRSAELEAAA